MTLGEKIFARKWVVDAAEGHIGTEWTEPGEAGFFRADIRFSHEYVTPMAAIFFEQKLGADAKVLDPDSILFFRDHLTFLHKVMSQERIEQGAAGGRKRAGGQAARVRREAGDTALRRAAGPRDGLRGDLPLQDPGGLRRARDAHHRDRLAHSARGARSAQLAFGVGTTAIFNSWITKDVRARIPPSFKVVVDGALPANCTAKDLMLEILRHPYVRDGHAIGQIVEYAGTGGRTAERGRTRDHDQHGRRGGGLHGAGRGRTRRTVEFLVQERGMDPEKARALVDGVQSDPGAEYVKVIEIDASRLRPMVALPGDPGNGLYIDELEGPVEIEIAYAGSCTAGKKEDMDMYARVFREAWETGGRGVHPDVECFIQCGSTDVREYARERGYLDLFRAIGAEFIEPGCGACIAAGPGITRSPDQVSVSSQNRNFPGRSGPGQLYLVSPYSVAASAVAGRVVGWEPGVVDGLNRSREHDETTDRVEVAVGRER